MLLSTRCPKCDCRMVVAGDSSIGLYVDDMDIEEIGVIEGTFIL